jgi:hypothetical protein
MNTQKKKKSLIKMIHNHLVQVKNHKISYKLGKVVQRIKINLIRKE